MSIRIMVTEGWNLNRQEPLDQDIDIEDIPDGEEENEEEIIMQYPLEYILTDKIGQTVSSGEASAAFNKEYLLITPKFDDPVQIPFRSMSMISSQSYRTAINLSSGDKYELSSLGYNYEDFCKILFELWNEKAKQDMLMDEKLVKPKTEGAFTRIYKGSNLFTNEECNIFLYDTGMVITTEKGYPIRIPYCVISEVKEEYYKLVLILESSEQLILSQMGSQFEVFKNSLSQIMSKLSLKVQDSIKEMLPKTDPSLIRSVSKLMREGKAARACDIKSISPKLWDDIEAKVKCSEIGGEYDFLKSTGVADKIAIGLKRGLLGNLTGEYIWFLIPIYSTDSSMPGNVVAMEAVSSEGGGRATYFFRLMSRCEYFGDLDIEQLQIKADYFIRQLNYCMLSINFRREPIYLDDRKLEELKFSKYKTAVDRIPELKTLRQFFIGRVMHSSKEQWKNDVMELLKFNIEAQDDSVKWKKNSK